MTIADLINIKKQLEGDIKNFRSNIDINDLQTKELTKKNEILKLNVNAESEKAESLQF